MPRGRGSGIPAVVLITGSAADDRDNASPYDPIIAYRPFRQIAHRLSSHGIAALRMDDRGVGKSVGGYITWLTTADRARDIEACIAYLRRRPEIDACRIGLIGLSEGVSISHMIASRDSRIKALVFLSGIGSPGKEVLRYQIQQGLLSESQLSSLLKGISPALTRREATRLSKEFLKRVGLARNPERLDDLAIETILAAQRELSTNLLTWRPVADGEVLPESPELAAERGSMARMPIIVGTSLHEAEVLGRYGGIFSARTIAELRPALGGRAKVLFERYRAGRAGQEPREIVSAILSDWFLRIPSIRFAEAHVANGAPVYMYLFAWTNPLKPEVRATHGSEGPFIFGTLRATGQTRDAPGAEKLSRRMQDAWLAFARTGDPNHAGIPRWHAYTTERRATMVSDETVREVEDPYGQDRMAWDEGGRMR